MAVDEHFCVGLLYNIFTADTLCKITDPPFKCPIRKGSYVGNKHFVDLSLIDSLPFDSKFKWILLLQFFEKKFEPKNSLGCWLMQISRTAATGRKRGGK